MIIAAIDVGTNTALLLVGELTGGEISPLYGEERIVRLGEGVDDRGQLLPEAIDRVVAALSDYKGIAARYGAQRILVSGTSAARDAANQDALLDRISHIGLEMRILSGEDEARMTWLGALSNKQMQDDILMMDIGGGSTEFMAGTQDELQKVISLNIGSVRLTERFLKSDPVDISEVRQVRACIHEALSGAELLQGLDEISFVGVAGTITTLASIHLGLEDYDSAQVDGFILSLSDIETILDSLQKKTVAEQKTIKGLNPKRADVVFAGTIILQEAMIYAGAERVLVSDRGLRYGLALDYAGSSE